MDDKQKCDDEEAIFTKAASEYRKRMMEVFPEGDRRICFKWGGEFEVEVKWGPYAKSAYVHPSRVSTIPVVRLSNGKQFLVHWSTLV